MNRCVWRKDAVSGGRADIERGAWSTLSRGCLSGEITAAVWEISCLPLLDLCVTGDRLVRWVHMYLGYSGSCFGMFGAPVHHPRSGGFAGFVAPLPVFVRS